MVEHDLAVRAAARAGYRLRTYFGPQSEDGPDHIMYCVLFPLEADEVEPAESDDMWFTATEAWQAAARMHFASIEGQQ